MPIRKWLVAILILWIGFSVRTALYDYHGLEGDDGYSLSLTRLDTPTLLKGLAALELDIHPPLHFLALKGWITLAGDSLIALRLMNILADGLTGALIIRMAGRLWGRRLALAAGLLWVLAPLLIYSDDLIRMYALLALWTAAGLACLVEAHHKCHAGGWYAGAAFFGLLAAETHVVGILVLTSLAAGMLTDWATRPHRPARNLIAGVGAFLGAGVLYWPYFDSVWALYRSGRSLGADISEATFRDPLNALAAVTQTSLTHRLFSGWFVGLFLIIILLVGSLLLLRTSYRRILPFLIVAGLQVVGMAALAWVVGFYKARYLTPLAIPLIVLSAGLIGLLNRRGQFLALVVVLIISASGILKDLDRSLRDDWVAAATFIAQHERPGDRIIVIPDWGAEAFQYHYQGHASVVGLFPQVSTSIDYKTILAEQTARASRVWYIHYQPEISDPDQLAAHWFRERAATLTEVFPAGMHIHYYDFQPELSALPDDARSLEVHFGDSLALRGVYLPVPHGPAQDTRLHPPSTWVQVLLYWEALRDQPEGTPRVRLTDPYAQVYGAVLERDNDVQHRDPTSSWRAGSIWEVAYDLNLNPETPPGTYNIEVMVLDEAGQPLPSQGADAGEFWAIAGQFTIE